MYQSANADPQFWRTAGLGVVGLLLGVFLEDNGVRLVGTVFVAVDCFILLCLAYGYVGLPIQSWRALENNRKEQTYEFSPDGVNERLANLSASLKWSVFSKVVETRDFYVFMVGGRRATCVPKRAFGSPLDHENYRQLVREQLPHQLRKSSAV